MRLRTRSLPLHLMVLSSVLLAPLSTLHPTPTSAQGGAGQPALITPARSGARVGPRSSGGTPRAASGLTATAAYGRMPLSFEPNQGQTDPSVQFLAQGPA